MKYVFSIIFLYFLIMSKSTADDIIHFPDSVLKQGLLEQQYYSQPLIDLNYDGEIQQSEAEAYTQPLIINYGNLGVKDLTGIKAFVNLKYLTIVGNTSLESIDLSGMKNLCSLHVERNKILKHINLSDCVQLEIIQANDNSIDSINLYNCKNLTNLRCINNLISNLYLSQFTKLTYLVCSNNNIHNIQINDSSNLLILSCNNNRINNVNISNQEQLVKCGLIGNLLSEFELKNAKMLISLYLDSNNLESLNIRNGNNQKITTFSTLGNPNLKCITVDDAEYSYQNWKNIDPWTDFSEYCNIDVKENNVPDFRIYPNPANNEIIFERFDTEPQKLKIIDISGNIVYNYDLKQDQLILIIDISAYPKGIYFIESGNEILVREKFVVEF